MIKYVAKYGDDWPSNLRDYVAKNINSEQN